LAAGNSNTLDSPDAKPARVVTCAVLLEMAKPAIYEESSFRVLGLSVLAGPRDVAKRVDELKLAEEFGAGAPDWSFAPTQALTVEQIRTAAQELKEPAGRLVQEFFWFWPENYPEDSTGDEALAHLERGETLQAVEYWQGAAMQGRLAALHNLAIYYHRHALELELQEFPPEEELIQIWFKALRFWEKISGDDALWTRLEARVKNMADARVTDEFVTQMRGTLHEALAKICAMLALSHGRNGWTNRASLHAALVTHIHGDTAGARRALEEYAGPTARRIEARSVEAEKRVAGEAAAGLAEAVALLRHCDEDLYLIELLCGRTADYFVEVSHGLVDTALDCVVGYQRETHDDLGCLPVLLRLLDLEASPELKARVAQTFDAVYQNALSGGSRPPLEGGESSDDSRALQLIVDEILPGLDLLGLGDASKQLCLGRVASLLKALALDAGLERDNLGLAMRAFAAALSLTVSEELHESLESDRAQLQRNFVERKEKELQVESEGSRLVIDRHGICLNDRWVTPDDFAGLRHGVLLEPETGEASHVIAWRSSAGEEFELNRTNLLPASSYEEDHYQRMLDSIYYFVVPALIERLAAEIRAGREVFLGSTRLGADGVVLPGLSTRFWRKDLPVPYSRLETVVEGGRLIVSSKDNPRQAEAHDVVGVWNAAIFSYVVEVLARE
jgi:hypothetical protein